MEFLKYQHLERLGTDEVDGILDGDCVVFYKIDGTNASVWMGDDGNICAGSRNRELSLDNDNQGFMEHVTDNDLFYNLLRDRPNWRLYGEWLVPHSLKTYRQEAWRKFYVFDVMQDDQLYVHYDDYAPILADYGLEFIPPLMYIKNPTEESIQRALEKSGEFLIEDGKGKGEGVVVKNYDFTNQYGRTIWAKLVTNEFKEKNTKTFGAPKVLQSTTVEDRIVDELCTDEFIRKEFERLKANNGGWSSKLIGELIGRIYHEFITEESWNICQKFKNPTVNFKRLQQILTRRVKESLPEVFG